MSTPVDSHSSTASAPQPGGERLARRVAMLRSCPRRVAEQYIVEGWVRVDGVVVELPQHRVTPEQRVEVDPAAKLQPVQPATLLLHQPAGLRLEEALALLAPPNLWSADRSGIRYSKLHKLGLRPLLPLPAAASGLAVFSQDGRVLRKLTEEAQWIEQELLAEVQGSLAPDGLVRLGRGLVRAGRPPAHVSWQSERRLRIAGKGLEPQQLGPLCAQLGLRLLGLRRLRIGRIPLAGLPAGLWRYLAPHERF